MLGDMFKGDSADTCTGKFSAQVHEGPSRGSRVCNPGSEDPHQCERKFWSERSACAALGYWHKRRWPLFLVNYSNLILSCLVTAVVKIPEGIIVVGFQMGS